LSNRTPGGGSVTSEWGDDTNTTLHR
jgi:hypothetical protein